MDASISIVDLERDLILVGYFWNLPMQRFLLKARDTSRKDRPRRSDKEFRKRAQIRNSQEVSQHRAESRLGETRSNDRSRLDLKLLAAVHSYYQLPQVLLSQVVR